jgi:hypothetical protein
MHPADVVVAEFGSVVELLTNHSDKITIFHAMAGEHTVEVFPVALIAVIPWQTPSLIADGGFADAEKVGIM